MMSTKRAITSVGYATERLLAVLASGLIVGFGLFALMGIGPGLEERAFPVLSTQVVTMAARDGALFTFELTVDKVRDCRFSGGDWAVNDNGHHTPVLVVNAIGRPISSAVTYSTGMLTIGPFTAKLPFNVGEGAFVYANLYYDCHFGWLNRQVLGPVPVPPPA